MPRVSLFDRVVGLSKNDRESDKLWCPVPPTPAILQRRRNTSQSMDSKMTGCSIRLARRQSPATPVCTVPQEKLPKPRGPYMPSPPYLTLTNINDLELTSDHPILQRILTPVTCTVQTSCPYEEDDTEVPLEFFTQLDATMKTTQAIEELDAHLSKLRGSGHKEDRSHYPGGTLSSPTLSPSFPDVPTKDFKAEHKKALMDLARVQQTTRIVPLEKAAQREKHRKEVTKRRDENITRKHIDMLETKRKKARDAESRQIEAEKAALLVRRGGAWYSVLLVLLTPFIARAVVDGHNAILRAEKTHWAQMTFRIHLVPLWRSFVKKKRRRAMLGVLHLGLCVVKYHLYFTNRNVNWIKHFLRTYIHDTRIALSRYFRIAKRGQRMCCVLARRRQARLHLVDEWVQLVEAWVLINEPEKFLDSKDPKDAAVIEQAARYRKTVSRLRDRLPFPFLLLVNRHPPVFALKQHLAHSRRLIYTGRPCEQLLKHARCIRRINKLRDYVYLRFLRARLYPGAHRTVKLRGRGPDVSRVPHFLRGLALSEEKRLSISRQALDDMYLKQREDFGRRMVRYQLSKRLCRIEGARDLTPPKMDPLTIPDAGIEPDIVKRVQRVLDAVALQRKILLSLNS